MKTLSPSDLFNATWKLLRGDVLTPTSEDFRIYRQANVLRGFSSAEEDLAKFNALLILAMSQTLDVQGQRLQAKHPVYFFLPGNLNEWVKQKTIALGKAAMGRLAPFDTELKQYHRDLIKQSLGMLRLELRPWRLEEEPSHWIAFGFKKGAAYLPSWLNEKLSET